MNSYTICIQCRRHTRIVFLVVILCAIGVYWAQFGHAHPTLGLLRAKAMNAQGSFLRRVVSGASDAPQNRTRPRPLSPEAIAKARKTIRVFLNTSTTFRLFRRSIKPESFLFGPNMTAVNKQNQTDPLPRVGPRCAVVGSSGLLQKSCCGREIDEHDFIFRVNLVPTGGSFARDAGSKSHVVIINREQLLLLSKKNAAQKLNANIIGLPIAQRLDGITNRTIVWYPKDHPTILKKVAVLFRDTLMLQPTWAYTPRSLMDLGARIWKIPLPSTGLSVVTAALLHCDDVTLYGFYPFPQDSHNRTVRYHYYEPDRRPFYNKGNTNIGYHRMPKEFSLYKKLEAEGALRMVVERCYNEERDKPCTP